MAVPYTFATATSSIPLSQLDSNFATGITLGNTTVYLGNTTTSIGNLTLTNATISSVATTFPNSFLANSSVTIGSTNISLGGTSTTLAGLTGVTSSAITDSGLTSGRVTFAGTGGLLSDSANLFWDNTNVRLGIGTASPANKLQIVSADNTQATIVGSVYSNNGTAALTLGFDRINGTNSTPANASLDLGVSSYPQAMRISPSGNVGIGTTSPSEKLAVNGGTSTSQIRWNVSNSTYVEEVSTNAAANAYVYKSYDASYHVWKLSSSEAMRIDSSGNLLVGTASNPSSWKVNVNGTIGANAISMVGSNSNISVTNQTSGDARPAYFANNNAGGLPNGSLYVYNQNDPNTTGYSLIQAVAGSTTRFIVYGNGAVNATGAYTNISDARIKKDIVDATPKLDKLMQVRVVNYTRTDHPDNIKEIGVISQELEQIFPNLIMEVEEKDKDNNVTCPDRKLVKYSVFIPILIKAMQEQQALIESLTTRLTALENK